MGPLQNQQMFLIPGLSIQLLETECHLLLSIVFYLVYFLLVITFIFIMVFIA